MPLRGYAERLFERVEVRGAEHHPVLRGDVDKVKVDAGLGGPERKVGERTRAIVDLDDDDLSLAGDVEVFERQRVLRGTGMGDEDVQFGSVSRTDARGCRNVHSGVADGPGDAGQRPRFVLDLDDQIHVQSDLPLLRCDGLILPATVLPRKADAEDSARVPCEAWPNDGCIWSSRRRGARGSDRR